MDKQAHEFLRIIKDSDILLGMDHIEKKLGRKMTLNEIFYCLYVGLELSAKNLGVNLK